MNKKEALDLAEGILNNVPLDRGDLSALAAVREEDVFNLLPGADMIREFFFGRKIHLCTICNAKSGKCSEDCAFCAQSAFANTNAPVYPLLSKAEIKKGSEAAKNGPVHRYSIVTSGKRLPKGDLEVVAEAVAEMHKEGINCCASLGTLDRTDLGMLKESGLGRYHHNLETSETFYPNICTTHSYQDRVATVLAAKEVGLSVCSGGLFGLGETDEQVLELALYIKGLDVDVVPINFLTPIKGTRLEKAKALTPLRCLKIIALFRYVLPDKEIIICGGREANLKELHPLVFYAGASGIMTGNYLTTQGRSLEQDLAMLEHLGLEVR
ncbi:MAG: biotin synthase BioB [Deltaproteobacteria bacterium]|nr:MAG: biotin synthase BioB [Deltaproteobacteria bacterium]